MLKKKQTYLDWDYSIPPGYKVIIKDDHIVIYNEDEGYKEDSRDCCYFCDFSLIVHKHHIIRRCDGGSDSKYNLIDICPNHHALIHRRKYLIRYSNGYYFLKSLKSNELIKPLKFDEFHKRKLPFGDLNRNDNLNIIKKGNRSYVYLKNKVNNGKQKRARVDRKG